MASAPQGARYGHRINACLLPPRGFVATMDLAMGVRDTGHGELIADFPPQRPALCKA